MRALVTGGAGFIGSHLVERLVADGDDVVVLDDLSTGYAENLHPEATFVRGDLADPDALARAVDGCSVVFHQAAHRAVFRSVEHPIETNRVNVQGTLALFVAARDAGVRRVVAASSSSVYGMASQRPTPETAPLVPRSPYAVTKVAGEQYCRVFAELYGLEAVSLRYFNVYGPRQRPDSMYATVIPLFVDALRSDTPAEVHGDGLQSRDFTYISDVVEANLAAARAPAKRCSGKAYNIAGGRSYSLLDLLTLLEKILDVSAKCRHVPSRAGDVRHTEADPTAATADLGFTAAVDFATGLDHTVNWFRRER